MDLKDLVSVKKLLAGEGVWTCVKVVLGWILDTYSGTLTLLDRNLEDLLTLVDIPATLRRIVQKYLEGLAKNPIYALCGARGGGPPLPL